MHFPESVLMKFYKLAALLIATTSAPSFATVVENTAGKDTLQITQTYFDVRVQGINDPGNSIRVEVRPRNGNCVGGGANPVTDGSVSTQDPDAINNAIQTSLNQPVLHDNPACFSDRWGYFTSGTSEGTYTYVLHGTLKSYTVQVWAGKNASGQPIITKLRTDAK